MEWAHKQLPQVLGKISEKVALPCPALNGTMNDYVAIYLDIFVCKLLCENKAKPLYTF